MGQKRTHALPQIISIRSTIITDPKAMADFQGALSLARPALITPNRKSVEQRGLLVVIGLRGALILGWCFGSRLLG
jgi:hypothetical protein